ncbi:MAG: DNA-binding protein WhiA [Tissierellia bacterium]|nr:DNA-binding protein WhiA [Tissierellia bacterium]
MSFSSTVKNELSRIKLNDNSLILAELAGFVRMCGTVVFSGNSAELKLITENASVARRLLTFLKKYSPSVESFAIKNRQLKKNYSYQIIMRQWEDVLELFYDTNFVTDENVFSPNYKLPLFVANDEDAIRAYLRASFLGAGSVTDPDKAYHAEFVTNHKYHAEDLALLLNSFNLNSKVAARKNYFIVYLKEAEKISDMLSLLGSNIGVLDYENVRIIKEMRNNVNRLVNCDTANLEKTVQAAFSQIEDIIYLIDEGFMDDLPMNLQEAAVLRLENPESSLKELSELSETKISKSGINHRLKKLQSIAEEKRGKTK